MKTNTRQYLLLLNRFGCLVAIAIGLAACSGQIEHRYPVSTDEARNSGDSYRTLNETRGSVIDAVGVLDNADERPAGRRLGFVIYEGGEHRQDRHRRWLRQE